MPLLWTAVSYGLMGVVNPLLQERVELALVHRLAVRLRRRDGDRRGAFGDGSTSRPPGTGRTARPRSPSGRPGANRDPSEPAVARSSCSFSWSLLAAGCSNVPAGPSPPSRPCRSDQVTDFATLYGPHCAGCHGADGQFGPAPPLNDPLFLAIVPDAVLLRMVAEGRPGTPMPAFSRKKGGPLTDEQVRGGRRGDQGALEGASARRRRRPTISSRPTDPGDAGRGRRSSTGRAPRATATEGLGGKGKVGPIHDPAFLALISDQAVRRYHHHRPSRPEDARLRRQRRAARRISSPLTPSRRRRPGRARGGLERQTAMRSTTRLWGHTD